MNLTLLISSLSPGGAERAVSELANHWATQNHTITIITLSSPNTTPFYPLDPRIKLIHLNQIITTTFPITRFIKLIRRIFCVRKAIKQQTPDHLISFVDVTNITALLATLRLKIPVIVSERTNPYHHKIPALYKKLRKILYPRAAHVVVQTQGAGEYFKGLKNVAIIPNAVTSSRLEKDLTHPVKKIISVGRLVVSKEYERLIRTFSLLPQNSLTLTIYGEGPLRSTLEALITSLNLQERVFLPGTTKDIREKLHAADLFVFPSLYEGFPNALCEAMAAGLPVVASNCSGNRDVIQDGVNGRLFPVGDGEAMGRIIQELIEDKDQRIKLGKNAKTISDEYSPERIYGMWDGLITQI